MPIQILEEYKGFYFEADESTATEFRTEAKGDEFVPSRFLDGLPAWRVSGFQRSYCLKAIILSNPLLAQDDYLNMYEKIL